MLGQKGDVLKLARPFAYFGLPHRNVETTKTNLKRRFNQRNFSRIAAPAKGYMIKFAGGKKKPTSKVSYFLVSRLNKKPLPWGRRAKTLLIALSSYAFHTKSRDINLGSLNHFVESMGVTKSSVNSRNRQDWKETLIALLETDFRYAKPFRHEDDVEKYIINWLFWKLDKFEYEPVDDWVEEMEFFFNFKIADKYSLWGDQQEASIRLSKEFYELCQDNPVALSANAVGKIRAISCLDLYCWCSANAGRRLDEFPVRQLHVMSGSTGRLDDYTKTLKEDLKLVKQLWGSPFTYYYQKAKAPQTGNSDIAKLNISIKLPPVRYIELQESLNFDAEVVSDDLF